MRAAGQRRYPPGLFDLPQDLARDLPIGLVEHWVRSDQTVGSASEILAETVVRGTTVVSDSAGLTRLTRERGLIEILALINRPKQIIHAYGSAVGGQAVGI
ncbi:MAG: family 3 adenylate cyclase, partial [Pseudomonadota bacterium]